MGDASCHLHTILFCGQHLCEKAHCQSLYFKMLIPRKLDSRSTFLGVSNVD